MNHLFLEKLPELSPITNVIEFYYLATMSSCQELYPLSMISWIMIFPIIVYLLCGFNQVQSMLIWTFFLFMIVGFLYIKFYKLISQSTENILLLLFVEVILLGLLFVILLVIVLFFFVLYSLTLPHELYYKILNEIISKSNQAKEKITIKKNKK